ncbi:MAG: hypothetical protein KAS32_08680 [Candidatus Peribacteraceae bacterium]|nr:hypothetical protein [Candidatus Peribacteraceae bacterium]
MPIEEMTIESNFDLKMTMSEAQSRVDIANGLLVIDSCRPMPNWFWRMWQYLLLGFRWEKILENENDY